MPAAQGLALKLRAAPPAATGSKAHRDRTTVRAAAYGGALQHRRCGGCMSLDVGRFLRVAPLPAAQQRARALPWAERAARRHERVVASAAGVRSMSKIPERSIGLYDPSFERDSCGVGFIAELSGEPSRKTVSIFATKRARCLELILPYRSFLMFSVVSMSELFAMAPA
jgi:glutamate synthase (NADH)